jgi:hypothetical protein
MLLLPVYSFDSDEPVNHQNLSPIERFGAISLGESAESEEMAFLAGFVLHVPLPNALPWREGAGHDRLKS